MLRRIDAHELTEWAAYFSLEPWGGQRDDFRSGVVAASIVNMLRSSGAPVEPADLFDTLPRRAERTEPQSEDEMKAIFKAVAEGWKP